MTSAPAAATPVERYYDVVEAPYKELVRLERSGHGPCFEEPHRFSAFMTEHVLRATAST